MSDALADLARRALADGTEQDALLAVERAAAASSDPVLWQWTGLLYRSLEELRLAAAAFDQAAALAPRDAAIARGRAHVALEAGYPAVELFDAAIRLGGARPDLLIGRNAARFAIGQGDAAAEELGAALRGNPGWIEGHRQFAQLQALLGRPDRAGESLDAALAGSPADSALWRALFALTIGAKDYAGLVRAVGRARAARYDGEEVTVHAAIAAAELGNDQEATRLFDAVGAAAGTAVWRIRQDLRAGRVDAAMRRIEAALATADAVHVWPYAATAWRLADDPRWPWLQADGQLMRVVELVDIPALSAVAESLRSLHVARTQHLDQSVRGGTQTDGALLSRADPLITELRAGIRRAIAAFVADLPAPDVNHPTLSHRRDRRIRLAGSWSVRLAGGGHHLNHVHPQGWISSALYIALPPPVDAHQAGWLVLGEPPPELGLDLAPDRSIEPVAGHVALFPSWMWHGTRPFPAGERLTVAFDVAPPR